MFKQIIPPKTNILTVAFKYVKKKKKKHQESLKSSKYCANIAKASLIGSDIEKIR